MENKHYGNLWIEVYLKQQEEESIELNNFIDNLVKND